MIFEIFHSFPIFLELTLHRQKTLFSIFWCFRDPNDLKIYEHQFLEGTKRGSEGSEQAEARGPRWVGPRGQIPWPRGTHHLGPRGSVAVDLFPEPLSWPKNDYKNSPRRPSERSAAETQKPRNRDLELQIGGGKLQRGAAGMVSIFSNDFSTVSMMKRE